MSTGTGPPESEKREPGSASKQIRAPKTTGLVYCYLREVQTGIESPWEAA